MKVNLIQKKLTKFEDFYGALLWAIKSFMILYLLYYINSIFILVHLYKNIRIIY